MGKKKYKIGEKINGFEILDIKYKPYKTNAKHRAMLLCKCPLCGKEKWLYAFSVVSEKQKSCGCLPHNIDGTEKAKELRAKSTNNGALFILTQKNSFFYDNMYL